MIFGKNKNNRCDAENKNIFFRKIIHKMRPKKNRILNNNNNNTSSSLLSALYVQQDQEQRPLSKLSTTMTQFVVETARKTHDAIRDEEERSEFLLILRDEMRSEVFTPLGNYQNTKDSITIPIAKNENEKINDTTTNKNDNQERREQHDTDDYYNNDDGKEKEESSSLSSISSTSLTTSNVSNQNLNPNPNNNNNSTRRRNSMNVIDFLVKTSQGTLESIPHEEDQHALRNYLRKSFRKEFLPSSQ